MPLKLKTSLILGTLICGALVMTFIKSGTGVAGDVPATAINPDKPTSFFPTCAPWDGMALSLNFELPSSNMKFEGVIWGRGYESFQAGKAFTIDNVVSSEGTGRAQLVQMGRDITEPPKAIEVTPHFAPPAPDDKEGKWTISIPLSLPDKPEQILIYSISPVIPELHPLCG